jgi:hypothetical protein
VHAVPAHVARAKERRRVGELARLQTWARGRRTSADPAAIPGPPVARGAGPRSPRPARRAGGLARTGARETGGIDGVARMVVGHGGRAPFNCWVPGGATDCGWSHQYNDRPAFRAYGELYYGGKWVAGSTLTSNTYNQFDDNWTYWPNSCNNTAGYYCHRWPTNADGTPVTKTYAFDLVSMNRLPSNPMGDTNTVVAAFQALPGGSPNWSLTPEGVEDVLFYAYNDTNDRAYARSQSTYQLPFPQIYYSGYTKFNQAQLGGSTDYRALVCHEFMHILGFEHITSGQYVGSKATCMGMEHNAPAIDDQWLIPKVYATPLYGG